MKDHQKPKLVILGTGFAAFSLLKDIDARLFDVTVVSPRNHFLFTPLLPSTTVGTIEFRSIIESIRVARPDVQYYQAWCKELDLEKKVLRCEGALDQRAFRLNYDILVIAVGSVSNTYGVPGVKEHALFLKDLADARAIRQKIIECFEQAAEPELPDEERKQLLRFVVVGGGPTGVEIAGEMHDFFVKDLRKAYPRLLPDVSITLLEATDHILSTFDAALSDYTIRHFLRQQINVRTGSPVTRIERDKVILRNGSEIAFGLLVWSTGIGATPLVSSLTLPKDGFSRLITDERCRIRKIEGVYAIGDCATIEGKNLPATAQVAQQVGKYLAKALARQERGKPVGPFRYRHYGMLAYIGSGRALADLATIKSRGFWTWLFWRSAYLTRLVSFKNKTLVIFDWFKAFVFGRDISRF